MWEWRQVWIIAVLGFKEEQMINCVFNWLNVPGYRRNNPATQKNKTKQNKKQNKTKTKTKQQQQKLTNEQVAISNDLDSMWSMGNFFPFLFLFF